ncbi:MAG: family 20 glycosylhydrolase [Crenarchaeota archaeon]|nr:family 20 glycosylhydrolase [Thermoproteota archaeon]
MELDHYSKRFHIDLIPSLASFGHLYELLRLKRFEHLNELNIKASEIPQNLWDRMAHYTIDPTNDESYELIKSMIEEYLPLFSSKYFNICCDETFDLGKGKNLLRVQKEGTGTLYLEFVKKLTDLVRSHGKTPMLWGDIIIKHPELMSQLPGEVIFLNWGYGADITDENIRILADAGVSQYVCPGIQGWSRFAYDIGAASENIRKMVQFGFQYKAAGVLNTDWGDCGHINFFAGLFHGMILGAALCWNKESYSDDVFDRAVSVLEWGDKSETLYMLLRELGRLCFYHFGNIYAWVSSGTEGLWNKEQKVREIEVGLLQNNYDRAVEIHSELINLRANSNQRRLEFDELVFGAKATVWTLALLLFKKRHEYNQRLEIPVAKAELIKMGYDVLAELIRLWRTRNKESELQNVVAVFRSALEKVQGL